MNTLERANEIRARLKALKINSKKVSVRIERFAGGSGINVKIKDAIIDEKVVAKIAYDYQRIDRCEFSGDILSGCNVYVEVRDVDGMTINPYKF